MRVYGFIVAVGSCPIPKQREGRVFSPEPSECPGNGLRLYSQPEVLDQAHNSNFGEVNTEGCSEFANLEQSKRLVLFTHATSARFVLAALGNLLGGQVVAGVGHDTEFPQADDFFE
jgi:hypothetical protein